MIIVEGNIFQTSGIVLVKEASVRSGKVAPSELVGQLMGQPWWVFKPDIQERMASKVVAWKSVSQPLPVRASLMRIRPETISSGKVINGDSVDIDLSDGELECREADSGVSFYNSDQPSLAPKGDDVGSSSTLQHTDAKERLLQGYAAPDRMDLEGGREASGPF